MTELTLKLLSNTFSVHRLEPEMAIPASVLESETHFIGQTQDELSIVCDANIAIPHAKTEPDWACFMVVGPLDFQLTGIIARISAALASERISLLAISTFDTDYVLVKETEVDRALKVLKDTGYEI